MTFTDCIDCGKKFGAPRTIGKCTACFYRREPTPPSVYCEHGRQVTCPVCDKPPPTQRHEVRASPGASQKAPLSGEDALRRMHDRGIECSGYIDIKACKHDCQTMHDLRQAYSLGLEAAAGAVEGNSERADLADAIRALAKGAG